MAKLHFPRKNPSLDMTAMCDVAFLLLTFFMLTTQFRPNETVIVDTPSSVSEIKIPEKDIITLTVDLDGNVFFGIDNQNTRVELLRQIGAKYRVNFTNQEIQAFALTAQIGVPIAGLKSYLSHEDANERRMIKMPGIPADSTNNELRDWVDLARRVNPQVPRVAIKADAKVPYKGVKKVMDTLQDLNINRFNMVTSLEAKPAEMKAREATLKAEEKH